MHSAMLQTCGRHVQAVQSYQLGLRPAMSWLRLCWHVKARMRLAALQLFSHCCFRRGASAAVIVYDITSSESFKKAQDWVKELQRQVRAAYKV